ncbi:MAG: MBL fold metallo-hydrolase [Candidatus Thorarchaeota archaeon]
MIPEIKIEEVTPRTVMVTGGHGNAGAVALSNFIICIDSTIYPQTAKQYRDDVEKRFNLQTKYLFITHSHGDHTFGAAAFKETHIFGSNSLIEEMNKKLEISWTQEEFANWIKEQPENKDLIEAIEIIIPKTGFSDTYIIKDDDHKVEFYHAGGHTAGSAYALFPQEKVLFAGDLIFAESFPWAGDPTCNPDKWIDCLREFLTLDFEKLVPGHGLVVGKEEVMKHLKHLEALREATRDAVKEGRGADNIMCPEFYDSTEDWIIPRSLEHWYKFYEDKP